MKDAKNWKCDYCPQYGFHGVKAQTARLDTMRQRIVGIGGVKDSLRRAARNAARP